MRNFRPLLFSRLDASAAGVELLRLAVHRHLPENNEVDSHRHAFAQMLLYLTGRGEQEVAGKKLPVSPGVLVVVAPGVPHAFHRTSPRAPLCLVIDFRSKGVKSRSMPVSALQMRGIRDALHQLAGLRGNEDAAAEAAGWSLVLLSRLRAIAAASVRKAPAGGLRVRLEKVLSDPGANALPVSVLAQRCGYQKDYLTRKLKEQTGLTLNQFRAQARLSRATSVLAAGGRSAAAASAAGFDDVNYFTRWFKQQTGLPPAGWKRRNAGRGH